MGEKKETRISLLGIIVFIIALVGLTKAISKCIERKKSK